VAEGRTEVEPRLVGADARVVGPARILIIDDEAAIRDSLTDLLGMEGFEVTLAVDGPTGIEQLAAGEFDLLLLDLALPGESGIDLLPKILEMQPRLPVIMITAYGKVSNVVDAIRAGAENFVQKPWDNEKLLADIRAAIGRHRAEEELVQLKRALKQRYNFENIVGKSEPMLRLFDLVAQVAPSRSTVLVQGESGTGKELIAKALHANSPRRDKPLFRSTPVRCRRNCSNRLSSGTFAGRLLLRLRQRRDCSRWQTEAHSSLMKSAPWVWICRPRFCAFCRIAVSCTLAAPRRFRWTCGLLLPPT